jgi:hypothetical protein
MAIVGINKGTVQDLLGITAPGNPSTGTGRVYYDTGTAQLTCLNSDGSSCMPASGGTGTVTNIATTGPITGGPITTTGTLACPTCVTSAASLTANNLIIGSGGQGVAALGSLGTTTTVLHGNASGAPTFGAVNLATDVTGQLPIGNVGSAGLSGTAPVGIAATGVISCVTCVTSAAALTSNQIVLGAGSQAAAVDSTASSDGSGHYTFSASAAASTPSLTLSGTPFTGGTATTNVPQLYINKSGNSAPSSWSTGGTLFGANAPSGFAGSFMDFHGNGGGSTWSLSATGTINAQGQYILTATNGSVQAKLYQSITNCSSSASPAVCTAAPAGSVVIAAAATTVQVNTTAVTANSQILVFEDSSLGTKLGVTCNTTTGRVYTVSARTAATNFTITASAAPSTNPACLSYLVFN